MPSLRAALIGALLLPLAATAARADAESDVRAALVRWAADFNTGRVERVCDLFAAELIADIQGIAERDFGAQCETLKRALADRSKTFTYAPDIKEVIVAGDHAVVRLDWTLTIRLAASPDTVTSVETGMDLFRRQPDGSWKIIRFMTFADE
jgi:ketosteroid isomerase-like protein